MRVDLYIYTWMRKGIPAQINMQPGKIIQPCKHAYFVCVARHVVCFSLYMHAWVQLKRSVIKCHHSMHSMYFYLQVNTWDSARVQVRSEIPRGCNCSSTRSSRNIPCQVIWRSTARRNSRKMYNDYAQRFWPHKKIVKWKWAWSYIAVISVWHVVSWVVCCIKKTRI